MRGLKFGFVRDSFLRFQQTGRNKAIFMFYFVPAVVAFGIGASHYYTQAFGIYLKYQAMVDTYNEQQTN
jgi:hypothetical protein